MTKKLSIQQLFNVIVGIIIAAVALVYFLFSYFVFIPAYNEENTEVKNLVLTCKDNIESRFKILPSISSSLAYNTGVQSYVSSNDNYDIYSQNEYVQSLAAFYCASNESVRHVLIQDRKGRYRTLYGGSIYSVNSGHSPDISNCNPGEYMLMTNVKNGHVDYCCYARNIILTKTGDGFGEVVGKLYVIMDTSAIQELLDKLEISGRGFVAVVDKNGTVQISSQDNVGTVISLDDNTYNSSKIAQSDIRLVMSKNMEVSSIRNMGIISKFIIVMLIILLGIILGLYYIFMRKFITPVGQIAEAMKNSTSYHARIDIVTDSELDIIVGGINNMLDRLEVLTKRIVSNQEKLYEMELLNQKSTIMTLQNQVNPHFLYNTLECMRSIAQCYNCKEISTICVSLSKIFRYSVQGTFLVTFGEEIAIVKEYMKIIGIRFPEKIDIEYDIDDVMLSKRCYKMILQPIVENSVRHGIEKISGKGRIVISIKSDENDICAKVSDNGLGMSKDKLDEVVRRMSSESENEGHIGLYNVNKRIELHYGKPYGLKIDSSPGNGTTVIIKIPESQI